MAAMRGARLLTRLVVTLLALGSVLPAGLPVCGSSACPMSAEQRELCEALGLDCCRTTGERASRASVQPDLVADLAPRVHAAPVAAESLMPRHPSAPLAAPALLQGVGLFTLFAVFLI